MVLGGLEKLRREGKISRVGAVFAPKRIGASTLAAMAVPPEQLDAVAAAVNRFPEVNHNYEREHRYNLWFVVTAGSEGRLQATLGAIEKAAGYPLLPLPLLEEFHIDLGFSLLGGKTKNVAVARPVKPVEPMDEAERRLVSVLQEGLPLFMRPFSLIAERIGASESDVLGRIGRWLEEGAIKRFGVVVRHHELGFRANAMVVHDIADDQVSELGRLLAEEPHPGIEVGGAVVGMNHCHRLACGCGDHVNFGIEFGQCLFQNDHGEDGRPSRDIARSLCHAVGCYHARACISLWRAERNASLKSSAWVEQFRAFFGQKTSSISCY